MKTTGQIEIVVGFFLLPEPHHPSEDMTSMMKIIGSGANNIGKTFIVMNFLESIPEVNV